MRNIFKLLLAIVLGFGLISCGSVKKVWPFEGGGSVSQAHAPANSVEYQCAGGSHFYLRLVDNGASAWLIYPDREVALTKSAGAGKRYSNGVALLDLSAAEATLNDGPTISYTGCKVAGK